MADKFPEDEFPDRFRAIVRSAEEAAVAWEDRSEREFIMLLKTLRFQVAELIDACPRWYGL